MLRRVVYTTNAIESLNYQLRKITKNRGHFPSEEAAVKLLWLAICNIEDKRAAQRLTDAGKPPNKRTGHTRLIQGHTTTNWKQALATRHLHLASIKTLKQRIQRPRATKLLHRLTPTSASRNNIIIIHHASILSNKRRIHRQLNTPHCGPGRLVLLVLVLQLGFRLGMMS